MDELREELAVNKWLCFYLGMEIKAADLFRVEVIQYFRGEEGRALTQEELRSLECTSRLSTLRLELAISRVSLWDLSRSCEYFTDSLRHLQSARETNERRDFLLRSQQPNPEGPYSHEIEEWGNVHGDRYVRIVRQFSRSPHSDDALSICTTGIFSNQRNMGTAYWAPLRNLSQLEITEICRFRLGLRLPRTLAWRPAPIPEVNPWLQGENQGRGSSSSSSSRRR